MHLYSFEKVQRRLARCCGPTAFAIVIHLTLLCLSCLQSAAFHSSSRIIRYSRPLKSLHFLESLPDLQLCDRKRSLACRQIRSLRRHLHCPLSISTKDDDVGAEESGVTGTVSPNATYTKPGISENSSGSVVPSSLSRTLLVAIPLMTKFALVLIIKFLTDLVVFPLLLTYRALRLSKRRMVKIWKQWMSWSSKTRESGTAKDFDIEGYNPNGKAP